MFERQNLSNARLFVGNGGAEMLVSSSEGEILWLLGFLPGEYPLARYIPDVPEGATVEFDGRYSLLAGKARILRASHGELAYETGANPDFKPRSSDQQLHDEMLRTLSALKKERKALKNREKAARNAQPAPTEAEAMAVVEEVAAEAAADAEPVEEQATE